jgi:hypothetical protein
VWAEMASYLAGGGGEVVEGRGWHLEKRVMEEFVRGVAHREPPAPLLAECVNWGPPLLVHHPALDLVPVFQTSFLRPDL